MFIPVTGLNGHPVRTLLDAGKIVLDFLNRLERCFP